MLLTKPLTTFLNANLTPYIHTLFLCTPTGKLLSSSSSHIPASTLRAQATLACSIWNLYKPLTAAGTISAALPSSHSTDSKHDDDDKEEEEEDENEGGVAESDPNISSIIIQLDHGTMHVRALKCSLLFVVIGPSPSPPSASSTSLRGLRQDLSYLSVASAASPPTSSHSVINGEGTVERRQGSSSSNLNGLGSSAVSVTGSTSGAGSGSIKVLRKQAEELGKWLDGELEGFSLAAAM
jgi:hypothetical protein